MKNTCENKYETVDLQPTPRWEGGGGTAGGGVQVHMFMFFVFVHIFLEKGKFMTFPYHATYNTKSK